MTADEVLAILEGGEFDAIAGTVEDDSTDFKSEPYQLDTDAAKYELAKDVAAFASAIGPSVIVFPIETERTPESPFERAVRSRPARRELVDEKRIRDVVRSHVYPSVREFDVRTYPSRDDADRVLVAIVVPAQRETDKPFLVLSPLGPDDAKIQGWLVGMPVRAGDETEHMRPSELHELILRGGGLAARVEEIATILAHPTAAPQGQSAPEDSGVDETLRPAPAPVEGARDVVVRQRMSNVADRYVGELNAWDGRRLPPVLILAAAPANPATVPTLFRDEGVRQILEQPHITRHQGWNLATLNRAELVQGARLEVRSGSRKLLDLGDDGTFVVVARVEDFLSRERVGPARLHKINSLALVEFTHDFALNYKAIAEHLEPPPAEAYFSFAVIAATGSPDGDVFLPPHGINSFGWQFPDDAQLPDTSDYTWGYVALLNRSAGEIAYPLLERVYGFFKHTAGAIPYLNEERTAVDPELFG